MKILIMCGGRGTRLGELTDQIPKPLIKLNNKTLIETKLEAYFRQGFDQFVFCIGYKGELIRETIAQSPLKIQVEFSDAGEEAGILERLGYAVISKSALELVPRSVLAMPDGEGLIMFYEILMGMGKLGADYHSGLQITFNTPEELKSAEEQLARFYTTRENNT